VIFFSLGLPTRFAEWCDAVIVRLVHQALGPVEAIAADTLEQFSLGIVKIGSPYAIVISRQIVGQLLGVLGHANRGCIVALDDPRLAVENLITHHAVDFLEATRVVAKSCASMVSCESVPRALTLQADQARAGPLATAVTIASHLELVIDEVQIANVVAAVADFCLWPDPKGSSWWAHLDKSQRMLITGAVDPYVARFAGNGLGPITWERELFFINEEQHEERVQAASRPVDITGRSRVVVSGPSITLPPGFWSATVVLGFSEEAAELSYIVDIQADMQLIHARIEPRGQPLVEVTLNFSITEPQMITVRIWNERAAFDGRLALGHVTMTPQRTTRRESLDYLSIALSG
jgi:hypothetical protein